MIYADKLYNDYEFEDLLKETAGIELQPLRKKNSKRAVEPWEKFWCQRGRKRVEPVSVKSLGCLLKLFMP